MLMQVLQQFVSGPDVCHYLPDRDATQQYAEVAKLSPEEYESLMNRGWRKFGATLFRPICAHCSECRPLRIPIALFTPNRSQQRTWRKNSDLEVRYALPSVDAPRLDLYRRYQAAQTETKGWPEAERTARSYTRQFVQNLLPSVEISLWEGGILRAVVITDITPNCVSGVYHFHDPDCRARGLGTYTLLHTIELARRLEKPWAYFGYSVAGCASMAYKTRFQPHEILQPNGDWEQMRV
jgi:arginyl-tRNA--protein-N-Asp/Glu arginylyltransferase